MSRTMHIDGVIETESENKISKSYREEATIRFKRKKDGIKPNWSPKRCDEINK